MLAQKHSPVVLFFFLLGGALVGTILSEALAHSLWIFARAANAGLPATTLDLSFIRITFGFNVRLTLGTVLGLLLGLVAYRRL
jgi:hypothetical protein